MHIHVMQESWCGFWVGYMLMKENKSRFRWLKKRKKPLTNNTWTNCSTLESYHKLFLRSISAFIKPSSRHFVLTMEIRRRIRFTPLILKVSARASQVGMEEKRILPWAISFIIILVKARLIMKFSFLSSLISWCNFTNHQKKNII